MSKIKKNGHWLVSMFGIACLIGAAAVMAQRADQGLARDERSLNGARNLAAAFRNVSKRALPSIVAIETVSRVEATPRPDIDELFRGTPFEEQFKNDPRFRQFFERGGPRRRPRQQHGRGSGFVIDSSGIIMTNSHVVRDADTVIVRFQDGRQYTAKDIKFDRRSDVAILRIEADGPLPALPMGDSDVIEVGDWVLAIGSPFGLDMSVTQGIISAKGRGQGITDREYFLQTDAAVNPGNSGGPLINLDGEVVGINTAISTRSGGYDGVSFAIPVNMAKWIGRQLMDSGKVRRAYLGIVIEPVNNDLAEWFGTRVGEGALVTDVRRDTPAERAKLRDGDVILKVNGRKVTGTQNLQRIVEELEIGKSYPIEVIRDRKPLTLTMVAEAMPEEFGLEKRRPSFVGPGAEEAPKNRKFEDLGVEITDLTARTAARLGLEIADPKGVVITDIIPDSPADRKGLRPGLIIEKVDTKSVADTAEFAAALEKSSLDKGVLLLIRRGNGKRYVVIKNDD